MNDTIKTSFQNSVVHHQDHSRKSPKSKEIAPIVKEKKLENKIFDELEKEVEHHFQ